jgi:hypothetical protein
MRAQELQLPLAPKKAYKGRSMVTGHDILKTKEIRAHEN